MTRAVQRVDKWLWHGRIFKTRSLAAAFAASGKLRINGNRAEKASAAVGPGDVLTFALGGRVRVLEIAGIAMRRGPYKDAIILFEDLSPPPLEKSAPDSVRAPAPPKGEGRPTKRNRRVLDRWRQRAE